jgi:DHA2 family multidrug resistance protein
MAMAGSASLKPSWSDPRWLPLVVTTVGSFMSILDSTIVNIALPSMLKDFHSNLEMGQLVITSYLMALAVVIPLSGFLAERVGMKRLYMITLGCFTAGSLLCGFAWDVPSLTGFRILQGLGGGMLQPLGMAIVFTMITPLERPYFMALLGIPVLIAPIVGPSLGGYLVQYSSWRTIFLINVPIGLIDIVLAAMLLKETAVAHRTKLDVRGFVLSAIGFPSLILGLTRGSDIGWTAPEVLALLTVGLVASTAFVRVELAHHDPMLQVGMFKDRMFALASATQWVGFFSLFGLNFILPIYLQTAHGWGPAQTGLALLPMGVVAFVTMNVAGRMYNRVGPRPLAISGLAVLAITTYLWSNVTADTGVVAIAFLVGGRGLALGLFSQTVQMVAFNTVPDGQMPRATALVNTGQRITGALSSALLVTALTVSLHLHGAPEGASVTGNQQASLPLMLTAFKDMFLMMTLISLVGMGAAWFLKDRVLVEWQASHRGVASEVSEAAS